MCGDTCIREAMQRTRYWLFLQEVLWLQNRFNSRPTVDLPHCRRGAGTARAERGVWRSGSRKGYPPMHSRAWLRRCGWSG